MNNFHHFITCVCLIENLVLSLELLRKSAEHTLMDMVQLLFSRLPQFKEDPKWSANMKKLMMRKGGVDPSRMWRKKRSPKSKPKKSKPPMKLHTTSHSALDTHGNRVPAKDAHFEIEEQEPAGKMEDPEATSGDNRDSEAPQGSEVVKDVEGNGEIDVSKELAEEVDRVNEEINNEQVNGQNVPLCEHIIKSDVVDNY